MLIAESEVAIVYTSGEIPLPRTAPLLLARPYMAWESTISMIAIVKSSSSITDYSRSKVIVRRNV